MGRLLVVLDLVFFVVLVAIILAPRDRHKPSRDDGACVDVE